MCESSRVRSLDIATMVLFFIMLAFALVNTNVDPDEPISELQWVTKPSTIASLEEQFPLSAVVYAKGAQNAGIDVKATVANFISASTQAATDCSTSRMAVVHGTLAGERLRDICRSVLSGGAQRTDTRGIANFSTLMFEDSQPGVYLLEFEAQGVTASTTVNLAGQVGSLVPVRYAPLLAIDTDVDGFRTPNYTFGEPFPNYDSSSKEPGPDNLLEVTVYNETGAPLEGVSVVIMAGVKWDPRDGLAFMEPLSAIDGRKHAKLANAVSVPSDVNGVARWNDFTVEGASSSELFLWFVAQGVAASWHNAPTTALRIRSKVDRVTIDESDLLVLPSKLSERDQLPPIRVQVVDTDNRPLPLKWVFALTYLMGGYHIFENQVPTSPHPEIEGGLLLKELMDASQQTDANGIATFHLSFTSRGQGGLYGIEFACDGEISKPPSQALVVDIVLDHYKAQFIKVPDAVEVMDLTNSATAQLALKVIDKRGVAIPAPNKLVSIRLLEETGEAISDREGRLRQSVQSVVTDDAGMAVFEFVITHLQMEEGVSARVLRLGAFMDGGGFDLVDLDAPSEPVGVSNVLEVQNPNPDLASCTGIVILNQSTPDTKIVSLLEVVLGATRVEPVTLAYIGVNSRGQQLDGIYALLPTSYTLGMDCVAASYEPDAPCYVDETKNETVALSRAYELDGVPFNDRWDLDNGAAGPEVPFMMQIVQAVVASSTKSGLLSFFASTGRPGTWLHRLEGPNSGDDPMGLCKSRVFTVEHVQTTGSIDFMAPSNDVDELDSSQVKRLLHRRQD